MPLFPRNVKAMVTNHFWETTENVDNHAKVSQRQLDLWLTPLSVQALLFGDETLKPFGDFIER